MKTPLRLLFALLLLFALSSCNDRVEPEPADPNALKVLPLGDSRVEGARGTHESYRYELWKQFKGNGWNVDFIGSRADEGTYPEFESTSFDVDHEGTGGAKTSDIIETLEAVQFSAAPEVVLLGIGGNDLLEGIAVSEVISNIEQIIQLLQGQNSTVTIFLEQIAPGESAIMTAQLTETFNDFNAQIPQVIDQMSNNTSLVVTVDMKSNWSDSYMADDVHYNEAGALEVATRYFNAVEAHVPKK